MKAKKIRDIIISIFLIASLSSTVIIVSCSEDDGILTSVNNPRGNYHGGTSNGIVTPVIASFFENVGIGAANQVGADLTGWALGALGLSASTPNYTNQLNQIKDDLAGIQSSLSAIDTELGSIDSTLNLIAQELQQGNCGTQRASLQGASDGIGRLSNLYTNYKSIMAPAFQSPPDTVSIGSMQDWVNQVLADSGYKSQTAVGAILGTMQQNLSANYGAIYQCVLAITLPPVGIGTDTIYYNNVSALVNYYYYWQTIGLFMLNEAYHFDAWVFAGSPGGSDSLYADSVQIVCSNNSNSITACTNAGINTNLQYNSLLTQFDFAGAPYTDDYNLLFYSSNENSNIFVRSLEDFTSCLNSSNCEAGYNCSSPLTNAQPCGPTAGYYYTTLPEQNVYRGTASFEFANLSQLGVMLDATAASSYATIGEYLESVGFQNMTNKTVMASQYVSIALNYSCYNLNFIPFFNTDVPVINGYALISTNGGFSQIFTATKVSSISGCTEYNASGSYHFYFNPTYAAKDSAWFTAYAVTEYCENNYCNFTYTDQVWSIPPPPYQSGYNWDAQWYQTTPKRYLWPVANLGTINCNILNVGGMLTKCGDDFTIFINANVPVPASCVTYASKQSCNTIQ